MASRHQDSTVQATNRGGMILQERFENQQCQDEKQRSTENESSVQRPPFTGIWSYLFRAVLQHAAEPIRLLPTSRYKEKMQSEFLGSLFVAVGLVGIIVGLRAHSEPGDMWSHGRARSGIFGGVFFLCLGIIVLVVWLTK
jgi:hypothetical protein